MILATRPKGRGQIVALANAGATSRGRQGSPRHRGVLAASSGSSTWRRWLVLASLAGFGWTGSLLAEHAVVTASSKCGAALAIVLAFVDARFWYEISLR
jgi:hypothetical protein